MSREAQKFAVIISPSQLERAATECQEEYELEKSDLISRAGKVAHLNHGIVIQRVAKGTLPSSKRRRTTQEQR